MAGISKERKKWKPKDEWNDTIIGEVEVKEQVVIKVGYSTHKAKGKPYLSYLNVRKWIYLPDKVTWVPTRHGLHVPIKCADEFLELAQKALAELRAKSGYHG